MLVRKQRFLHGEPALILPREHPNFVVNEMMFGGAVARPPVQTSLRFRASNSAYLSWTTAGAGNRKTFTRGGWFKPGTLGADLDLFVVADANNSDTIRLTSTGAILIRTGTASDCATNALYRDRAAFYHWHVIVDTTQATAADRVQLWVNGVRQTFASASYPSLNADLEWGKATTYYIGRRGSGASNYYDGLGAYIYSLDGLNAPASDFAKTDAATGQWVPKRYAGSFGTYGRLYEFKDTTGNTAATIGKDTSGNGNNATPNGIDVTTAGVTNDASVDVPTNSYARFDPLGIMGGATTGPATLSEANTKAVGGALTGRCHIADFAIPPNSGVWFWEAVCISGTPYFVNGILRNGTTTGNDIGSTANGYTYRGDTGNKRTNSTNSAYGATFTTNDVIGCKFDSDNGTLEFFKNGTSQGVAFTGIASDVYFPAFGHDSQTLVFNSGWRPFAHPANQGTAKTLCTGNLPTPSIKLPSLYFAPVLYTGDGSTSNRALTGFGLQPDFTWFKDRVNAANHVLMDSTRGAGNSLYSNTTGQEVAEGELVSFDSDGITIKRVPAYDRINGNTQSYVVWCWKKGVTPGFDIQGFVGNGSAGRTVSHNLGATPHFMIVKNRTTNGYQWMVYHRNANASPATGNLYLQATSGFTTDSTIWNNTAPTSSVFTLGSNVNVNENLSNIIAYLWTEIPGFSRIGSYVGNSSSDGTRVDCGFRPALVLIKSTAGGAQWMIYDDKRDGYNVDNDHLNPDDTAGEGTDDDIDFLSNGFKLRRSSPNFNDGSTFIFAAFARAPFKYANAR
jgi:hypothetical protein